MTAPRTQSALSLVLLLLAAASLCGCSAAGAALAGGVRLGKKEVVTYKAEYEIGRKPIVVIPFRDQRHTYYESRDGVDLATVVTGELIKRGAATDVKLDPQLQSAFEGQDPDRVVWADIGRKAGAELVLFGSLDRFTLKDPKTIGIVRGTAVVNFFIYDVKKDGLVYTKRGLEVYHPETGAGIAESDISSEKLRRILLAKTAMKIVQKFYTYKEKIRPPPARY